jgi:hypothetical protein
MNTEFYSETHERKKTWCKWEFNIKTGVSSIGSEEVDKYFGSGMGPGLSLVNVVVHSQVPYRMGKLSDQICNIHFTSSYHLRGA